MPKPLTCFILCHMQDPQIMAVIHDRPPTPCEFSHRLPPPTFPVAVLSHGVVVGGQGILQSWPFLTRSPPGLCSGPSSHAHVLLSVPTILLRCLLTSFSGRFVGTLSLELWPVAASLHTLWCESSLLGPQTCPFSPSLVHRVDCDLFSSSVTHLHFCSRW